MAPVHRLSRRDARRVAVRAQLLSGRRPADLFDVVRRLTSLQLDWTAAVAPSADLVLWSRLGSSYSAAHLRDALADRTVIDLRGLLRPAEDIALYTAEMAAWPGVDAPAYKQRESAWVTANDMCRRDILRRLRAEGPLTQRELPDSCRQPWASSGWNNNKNIPMMLDFMSQRGEVAAAGRRGRDRLWDLAERVYPDVPAVPLEEAALVRRVRRLAALGIARQHSGATPVEPVDVGEVGEVAVIDGVAGEWRVDPAQLEQPFEGRAALLSPLDRLVHDRQRMRDLFEFDYALEMYKPVEQRQWGYYALPILYGDRLVGKLDATADKRTGVLRVDAVYEDEPFTKAMAAAIDAEIADLGDWLHADVAARKR